MWQRIAQRLAHSLNHSLTWFLNSRGITCREGCANRIGVTLASEVRYDGIAGRPYMWAGGVIPSASGCSEELSRCDSRTSAMAGVIFCRVVESL